MLFLFILRALSILRILVLYIFLTFVFFFFSFLPWWVFFSPPLRPEAAFESRCDHNALARQPRYTIRACHQTTLSRYEQYH